MIKHLCTPVFMNMSYFFIILVVALLVQCSTGIKQNLGRVFGDSNPTGVPSGALTCYSCDSDASPNCITDPEDYWTVTCRETDTHCYTYRIEIRAEVTIDRGCCEVKEGSPICPLGPNFQIDENEDYTRDGSIPIPGYYSFQLFLDKNLNKK